MKPEERAEKIAKNYICNGNEPETAYEKGVVRTLTVLISEAIAEAEREADERALKKYVQSPSEYWRGFSAAKAKAVVVARMGRACGCPDPACAGNLIAAQIERMEP